MATPPSKKEVLLALLERSEARVHIDARRPGVLLPDRFLKEGHLLLDYGYRLQPPITDLMVTDSGISATLSFSRLPFATFIPWSAVYLISDFDGNGSVWQEDIPTDLLEASQKSPPPARTLSAVPADATPEPASADSPPSPSAAPSATPSATEDGSTDPTPPTRPTGRPNLRLVK